MDIVIDRDVRYVNGKAKGNVRVRDGDTLLHQDRIDLCSAKDRTRYCEAVAGKLKTPEAADEVELLLLVKLDELRQPANNHVAFDVSNVVRPDLFIRPEVIGLSVAQPVLNDDGRPAGKWMLHLLWADGRREVMDLPETLDLPDGSKLWIDPLPCDPTASTPAGWSRKGRQRWLDGEPAPDPVQVFNRLCDAIDSFIVFPEEHAGAMTATLALFVMFTYLYPAWNAVPYLFLGGSLSSGKTRVFEVLARLVFRPVPSSNMTGPSLFRTLNDRGGTLLLDEAERLKDKAPEAGEVLNMLLAGYKQGGRATRLEKVDDGFKPVEYAVYGPKALACINGLPPALASRCIQFIMFRAAPGTAKCNRRVDADPKLWADLRDDLHALALGPMGQKAIALSNLEGVCLLSNRNYELWQPLMSLAAWLEGEGADDVLALVQNFAAHLVESSTDDATPDADESLLRILARMVMENRAPTPGEILAGAKRMEPETFQRWQSNTVSRILKRYSFETSRSNGERVYRVSMADLRKVQTHYRFDLGIDSE